MSGKVVVYKADTGGKLAPIFEEIGKRFEDVRRRAFEFFQKRGAPGDPVDDWLKAEREIMGWPAAELIEKEGAYEAGVALPGFEAKDIEVTVTPLEIVVHAVSKEEKHGEEKNVVWTEFGSRDLFRRLAAPEPIDTEKTTATIEKGMLRIVAPKAVAKAAVTSA